MLVISPSSHLPTSLSRIGEEGGREAGREGRRQGGREGVATLTLRKGPSAWLFMVPFSFTMCKFIVKITNNNIVCESVVCLTNKLAIRETGEVCSVDSISIVAYLYAKVKQVSKCDTK